MCEAKDYSGYHQKSKIPKIMNVANTDHYVSTSKKQALTIRDSGLPSDWFSVL